jgi:predicted O-methyltransferase YrrM
MNLVRRTFTRRQHKLQLPDRASNPYATHVPVLAALSLLRPYQRIVELGSGVFSTTAFLNRTVFPQVEHLLSIENDNEWFVRVRDLVCTDSRASLVNVTGPIALSLSDAYIEQADLVMIDDSTDASSRAATIRAVLPRLRSDALMVIHDFEIQAYRDASKCIRSQFMFDVWQPCTGLLSHTPLPTAQLKRLKAVLTAHRDELPLDNLSEWHRVLKSR